MRPSYESQLNTLLAQRTESLKFKTESVLKKYLIVPAYLNFRNDLNVVLNFSVDIIRFRRQKLHTEIFSIQYTEKWKLKNQAQIKKKISAPVGLEPNTT